MLEKFDAVLIYLRRPNFGSFDTNKQVDFSVV